jgi:hypothetical protein
MAEKRICGIKPRPFHSETTQNSAFSGWYAPSPFVRRVHQASFIPDNPRIVDSTGALGGGTYTGIEAVSNKIQSLAEPRVLTGKLDNVLYGSLA